MSCRCTVIIVTIRRFLLSSPINIHMANILSQSNEMKNEWWKAGTLLNQIPFCDKKKKCNSRRKKNGIKWVIARHVEIILHYHRPNIPFWTVEIVGRLKREQIDKHNEWYISQCWNEENEVTAKKSVQCLERNVKIPQQHERYFIRVVECRVFFILYLCVCVQIWQNMQQHRHYLQCDWMCVVLC